MKIDITKMKKHWFEDANGNVYEEPTEKAEFYHHCFPCEIAYQIDSYGFHPKGTVQRILSRVPMLKKMIEKKAGKTFQPMVTFHTSYGSPWAQKTIIAMVNSGDFTLEQAIWVFTSACERCMNVLIHKYAPETNDGYEEFSEAWEKCNTVCNFCREDQRAEGERRDEP